MLIRYATDGIPEKQLAYKPVKVALPARFERATCGLGNRRSIHLSYGSKIDEPVRRRLEGIRQKAARLNTKAGWLDTISEIGCR
jgi:hypothetical protein